MSAPRLLIANRGEIARRILRSARSRGYAVAVVSTGADRGAPVRGEADRVFEVPGFLDAEAVVAAASEWRADLLHPGYGFLSEKADFAAAVEAAGISFVGPAPETMRRLGDKQEARRLASEAGVPVLAGADPPAEFPVAVKAVFGGGGIGIRVVRDPGELDAAVAAASSEAKAAFGDGAVYLERWLDRPRHVEIQVFGDGRGGGIHLGERECSVQRRRQKLVEWTPAWGMSASLRRRMGEAALRLVRATAYRGAGTAEFLLDRSGAFFFLELNARLQVEHPVTEAAYGVDLVEAQLALAEGEWPASLPPPVPEAFEPLVPLRAAVEARVLAESPRAGFAPSPGQVRRYREPAGEGIRVDSAVVAGSPIPASFDSLAAKVIASGATLPEACERLASALADMVVHGVETNLALLCRVLRHPDFLAGRAHSGWVEERLDELVGVRPSALAPLLQGRLPEALGEAASGRREDPAALVFRSLGDSRRIEPGKRPGEVRVSAPDREPLLVTATALGGGVAVSLGAETVVASNERDGEDDGASAGGGEVRAPLAGRVVRVRDEAGAAVERGEVVAVVESMKMHWEVRAPASGILAPPESAAGETVAAGALLARITPCAAPLRTPPPEPGPRRSS